MPVINGNDIGIYVDGVLIGCLTGGTWASSRAEIDVTCKDNNGDRQVILGGATTNINFSGFFVPDSTYGLEDLVDAYLNKTLVDLRFGDTSGTYMSIYQQCYLQELTWDAPLNAGSTFTGKFSATGTPEKTET